MDLDAKPEKTLSTFSLPQAFMRGFHWSQSEGFLYCDELFIWLAKPESYVLRLCT